MKAARKDAERATRTREGCADRIRAKQRRKTQREGKERQEEEKAGLTLSVQLGNSRLGAGDLRLLGGAFTPAGRGGYCS